jgi:FkbM family methyltransferase
MVRPLLNRTPGLYRTAAMVDSLARWMRRRPHDVDYRKLAGDHALVIDVGGNRGQSALSFAVVCPRAQIVTFEPNPDHNADLRFVARVLRGRMTYHLIALGSFDGVADLWVPMSGRRAVTGEGSLDRAAIDRARRRVVVDGHSRHRVDVRRLDSFGLAPDVIKIDVQGNEADVLAGATETLMAHRPLVLVEAGIADTGVAEVLEPLGYRCSGGPRNWLWTPA